MTTPNNRLALALPVVWNSPSAAEALWSSIEDAPVDFVVLGLPGTRPVRRVLDPSIAAAALQSRHPRLRLLVALSAEREHPYNIARRIGSLDSVSNGRIGWLAIDRDAERTAGGSVWAHAEPGSELTADAVAAAIALWHTWPRAAIVADRTRGVFIESEQIRFADHDGLFRSRGPLNVPSSTQGHPVVATVDHAAPGTDLVIRLPNTNDAPRPAGIAAGAAPQVWQTVEVPHPADDQQLFARRLDNARDVQAGGASVLVSLPAETDLAVVTAVISALAGAQPSRERGPEPESLRERLGLAVGGALTDLGKSAYAPAGLSSHTEKNGPEQRSHIF
ncbi:LLM class flavin-dependent oxidoreductase [Pseudoclavibacter sp. CFCC 14310]|uniref:LLM class flavin-dependent oxidoreductase n=1 Tax=Pseudoclavibacter sp. CFCC 14310 TaxID=2615180 RepID=UPI00130181BD|nr:LLM class flavin-dependent oxidoreductase [Pseudoclavibacter sp. CFCC 14310]KAB1644493.1 LLM class flavin-dependent oxidoreductase [Pseudoclavibacter sp. CFCC 14310]